MQHWLDNPEIPKRYWSIDLKEKQAVHAAITTVGSGCYIQTENEELKKELDRIMKLNFNFDSYMFQVEKVLSAWGGAILTISKTKGNQIRFDIGTIPLSRYARVGQTAEGAVVWYWYMTDLTGTGLCKTTYTTTKIIRQFYVGNEPDSVQLYGEQTKISNKLKLPLEETHNLGFVPIVIVQNLPKFNPYGSQWLDFYPDDAPVNQLQQLLDVLFINLTKELQLNRTRVFGSFSIQETINMIEEMQQKQIQTIQHINPKMLAKLLDDFLIQTNQITPGTTQAPPLSILQGDPKIEAYLSGFEKICDIYTQACHYSPSTDSNIQKTENEILFSQSQEQLVVNTKRRLRRLVYKELLDKALMWLGWDEKVREEYSFELRENLLPINLQFDEQEQDLIMMGLSSKVNFVMRKYGFSEDEARAFLLKIDEQNKEFPIDDKFKDVINQDIQENKKENQF